MGYNMYDKNYGSSFTPENDNRPSASEQPTAPIPPTNSNNCTYHYGFQPAEEEYTPRPRSAVPPPPPVTPPAPPASSGKTPKKRSGDHWGKIVAIALVCALLGGITGMGGAFLMFRSLEESKQSDESAVPQLEEETAESPSSPDLQISDRPAAPVQPEPDGLMSTSQIYDVYADSVVSIEVQTNQGIGAGTGFLISEDGYIMTCYHVVEGYQALSCTFIDSTSYEAEYIGGDKDSDLAVLKITPEEGKSFKPVVIGDSAQLSVGGTVTAIGNALGTFANTTTSGTVSGLDRALTMSDGTVLNVLQTDCTVNSGNSGGPLFNEYGEVIGVVNAKYSNNGYSSGAASIEGIGFAIPINDAMAILDDLITHGYITGKPYLGISVATVSSITAQQYSNMVVGAYVRSVEVGSCAETAGLQVGDIITQVGDKDITTYEELIDAKNTLRAGDQMTLTVFREDTYLTIVVTLDEEVPESAAGSDEQYPQQAPEEYQNPYGGQYMDPFDFFNDFFGGYGW